MTDDPTEALTDQQEKERQVYVASVRSNRRISPVWIVPIAALFIGVWTLVQSYISQGPQVRVQFATAEGLVAGETPVKTLDVEIGVVERVELADDFASITALVRLDPKASELLTEDAQFWVVRPQVGSQGISGLSTILSGSYIQLSPGEGKSGAREFRGLDAMPVTAPSTPGLPLQLIADTAGSVNVGSPILYNGYRVGRIEGISLDTENGQTRYAAFIDAPYDDLVTTTTRFWNASGVSVSVDVGGFDLRTESLEALLTGGVAFGVPEGYGRGQPVQDDQPFLLYDDIGDLTENPHVNATEYVLMFESSIRGLSEGAPVDYRGLRVGTVLSVGAQPWESLWSSGKDENSGSGSVTAANALPVVVHLEPGWLGDDTYAASQGFSEALNQAVEDGLRASLAIGNLFTGNLYVSLDFHDDAAPASIARVDGELHMPTVASGLDELEEKVAGFLGKLQQLPIEDTLNNASAALAEAKGTLTDSRSTLAALTNILESPGTNDLPDSLVATLADAQTVLQSFGGEASLQGELVETLRQLKQVLADADSVLQTYEKQPNAFVFPIRQTRDPVPEAGVSGDSQ